jgi:polar amino acid transport system substrate-binding protein
MGLLRWISVLMIAGYLPLAMAQQSVVVPDRELVVATKNAPPFAIKNDDGSWSGISIDLWREIASRLGLKYRLQEDDLSGMLAGVSNGKYDAAVAALTVTAERELKMDFSHPFYTSGLSIAVPANSSNAWLGVVQRFFTLQFVTVVMALLLLLLIIGGLVWLFEHRRNQQFGGPAVNGIGSGLWWSAVTMTTVGYGDKAPVTVGGRFVALVWMFASIIIISSFTAAIASALTVGELSTGIRGPQDLYHSHTGSVKNSSSAAYLDDRHIAYTDFNTVQQGLAALTRGEIDAFVYDQPLLQYAAKTDFQGQIQVLSNTFRRQDYAIALPDKSPLKEEIDQQLLVQLESTGWQQQVGRYLGVSSGF